MDTDVGVVARKRRRHVVDVAAATVVVDHAAHRQGVGNQRKVEHCRHVGVRITVSGHSVARLDISLGDIELRLVGDVADRAGFGAGSEQRALWTLQDFDTIYIGSIDVKIAIRKLAGLIVQIDRDIGIQPC